MRVTAIVEVDVPSDTHIGDEFTLSGEARVVLIRETQVTLMDGTGTRITTVPGQREYELQVNNGQLVARKVSDE